ncbi:MAG: hypothetical protein ACRDEA_23435, partial [Microcystaceae cyanobacterium]
AHRARDASSSTPLLEVEAQLIETPPKPDLVFLPEELAQTKKALAPAVEPRWWKLNDKHWLYQGHQEDETFICRLPDQIALWLAFAPSQDNWPAPPPKKVYSGVSLFTAYSDINLKALRTSIKWLLEYSTEGGEAVAISRLSDPSLLVLLDKLAVVCYVAEPDEKTCSDILTVWKSVDGEVSEIGLKG